MDGRTGGRETTATNIYIYIYKPSDRKLDRSESFAESRRPVTKQPLIALWAWMFSLSLSRALHRDQRRRGEKTKKAKKREMNNDRELLRARP